MKRRVIIDGDLPVYAGCAKAEYDYLSPNATKPPEEIEDTTTTAVNVCRAIENIIEEIGDVDEWVVAKSSRNNYRKLIAPSYKSNRKDVWKPARLKEVWRKIAYKCDVVEVDWLEADDLVSIYVTDGWVGASIDKDLLQVEGTHYRWGTNKAMPEWIEVDDLGFLEYNKKLSGYGEVWLAAQCLLGDSTDGFDFLSDRVKGIYKSGVNKGKERDVRFGFKPKEVLAILKDSFEPMVTARESARCKFDYTDRADELFNMNANCAAMLRELPDKDGVITLFDGTKFQLPKGE